MRAVLSGGRRIKRRCRAPGTTLFNDPRLARKRTGAPGALSGIDERVGRSGPVRSDSDQPLRC
ncbi:hypothetical protein XAC3562_870013 [Xanthomonas citri pv. citri]|uniref:Uncharacterized protein n=1 Tax=Xanthomonas citri pv. citri TaxID=611301 RepID=A0A0U5FNJ9_XANCI|nr:hypothetical protein XAC3824_900039 [Xanthomonas citri pv. citri]CEG18639.1 hypothetical protein XAC3562_870013 [Xanthomonas citri pv. citri]CEH63238.1 hypothetical protein XACLG97_8970012 [Xanthomonas citri pv. citri]CEH77932.1 hypothetical protein XAC3612_2270044 [Xanthomonas citri pv. citri]CEH86285.1 hypothetical protein XAC3607_3060029 [Xanthomonas citri pv. citri]